MTVPIIVFGHNDGARLGNKVFQFALARKVAKDMSVKAEFQGFKLDFLSGLCGFVEASTPSNPLVLDKFACNQPSHAWVRDVYFAGGHDAIVLKGWGTRAETVLPLKIEIQDEINALNLDFLKFDSTHVLVNLRLSEILANPPVNEDYLPLPISYYRTMIRRLGKQPVFVGQMTESDYLAQLRTEFPEAQFIDLEPQMAFETIRRAPHKIIAMSTFSWMAAWLGPDSTKIVMPLTGAFNFFQRPDWNLTPWNDERFSFNWLFPTKRNLTPIDSQLIKQAKASFNFPRIPKKNASLRRFVMKLLFNLGSLVSNKNRTRSRKRAS
jgi:hypothetical protein